MKKSLLFVLAVLLAQTAGLYGREPLAGAANKPALMVSGLNGDRNYIAVYTPLVSGIKTLSQIEGKPAEKVALEVTYFDGLGRPLQSVQVSASPNKKDIVQPFSYDQAGREAKKYLPYEDLGDQGSYRADAINSQAAFYNSPPAGVVQIPVSGGITPSYSETLFEKSPLNRETEQGFPGSDWNVDLGRHTVRTVHSLNSVTDDVLLWSINGLSCTGYGTYAAGDLFKVIAKDENWQAGDGKAGTSEEYRDKEGRLVLKRQWKSGTEAYNTYYVHNDMGQLRYVLPPAVQGTGFEESLSDASFAAHVYAYRYDHRGRVTGKKIPGMADWEEMVYDQRDQLVMSRDPNLMAQGKWLFSKYDALGREAVKGIISSSDGRLYWQGQFDAAPATALWEDRDDANSNGTGYTSHSQPFHSSVQQYHEIHYYDDYGYPGSFSGSPYGHYHVRGLETGGKTNVLGTAVMLASTTFYDKDWRPTWARNQAYRGGENSSTFYYNFQGQVDNHTESYDNFANAEYLSELREYYYEFDHAGRLASTLYYSNYEDEDSDTYDYRNKTIAQHHNSLGQLEGKDIEYGLQEISYRYNERGWLSAINDPGNLSGSRLFGMELQYNQGGGTPQYNGNLSSVSWQTAVPSGLGLVQEPMSYRFGYDRLGRLTGSRYGSSGVSTGYFDEFLDYDAMGNIQGLGRYGLVSGRTQIDSLDYGYSGGRLVSVTDISGRDEGYKSGTGYYSYDANGNLTGDSQRGISGITYNHLNLPETFTRSGGNIVYTYDAKGNKLRRAEGGNVYDYEEGVEFTNGGITSFSIPEGRMTHSNGVFQIEYYLKDHLGTVRSSYFHKGIWVAEVKQVDHYYPFGMRFENPGYSFVSGAENDYLYNGKELQRSLGLYDYGARLYDPVVGRWGSVDPLAEKFAHVSGYNYALNNPGINIDPDGRETYSSLGDKRNLVISARMHAAANGGGEDDKEKEKKKVGDSQGMLSKGKDFIRGLDWDSFVDGTPVVGPALSSGDKLVHGDYLGAAADFGISLAEMFTLGLGTGVNIGTSLTGQVSRTVVTKGGPEGGLNLFKFGSKEATSSAGWKSGDRFLKMFDQGSPKLNWKQNSGFLRSEMNLGKPIFDSYRLPNGNLIPTGGFLNAERSLLQSRGWIYSPGQGAWLPSGF